MLISLNSNIKALVKEVAAGLKTTRQGTLQLYRHSLEVELGKKWHNTTNFVEEETWRIIRLMENELVRMLKNEGTESTVARRYMSAGRQEMIFKRPNFTLANLSIKTCQDVARKMEAMPAGLTDAAKFEKALSELREERRGRHSSINNACVLVPPDHDDTGQFVKEIADKVNGWLESLGIKLTLARRTPPRSRSASSRRRTAPKQRKHSATNRRRAG